MYTTENDFPRNPRNTECIIVSVYQPTVILYCREEKLNSVRHTHVVSSRKDTNIENLQLIIHI